MVLQALRSLIFWIVLFSVTAILSIMVALSILIPPWTKSISRGCAWLWMVLMRYNLRLTVGISYEITGRENIPETGAIIAAKHQSDFDIIALYPLFNFPSFIAKKQLFQIPVFGTALRVLKTIEIDRSAGSGGMKGMVADARKRIDEGNFIFIFPEGTRKAPLAEPDYRFGVAKMYESMEVSVLPIALNTGLYWGRNSFVLWPGKAKISILPPIGPGLSGTELIRTLRDTIDTETTRLVLEAVDEGLTRPIDSGFRQRIDAARTEQSPAAS
ncbi:MAG: 1-acyl-sn-glycerol-3-phosphate acyltransferase [Hyphomicrobiaceae bacterium]|nr:1-acyl-sn-glycerol-3-phosphate acyltransferase [Hyphomicrobiaceae bacterium]MCC0023684.1 1-acyl-sn-glycerol-3-phosphate acyltransferase [Hyphomicrobiaceae bacterium]